MMRYMRAKHDEGKNSSITSEPLVLILFLRTFNSAKENLLDDKYYTELMRSKIGSFTRLGTHFDLKTTN